MRPPLPAALVHRGARRFKQADVALLPQHALGGGPKTLGNAAPVDVVVPPVVGGPEQGRPLPSSGVVIAAYQHFGSRGLLSCRRRQSRARPPRIVLDSTLGGTVSGSDP
jgi:hypothetical protein